MLVVLPLLITVAIFHSVSAAENECSDVLFLYTRASGQQTPGDEKEDEFSGQREGLIYSTTLEEQLPEDISFKSESLNYPAFGDFPEILWADWDIGKKDGEYWTSKNNGTAMVKARVAAEQQRCPYQQIVLSGFSQGAHAIGDALSELTEEQSSTLTHISMFGDPRFNPDSYAARGTFRQGPFDKAGGILEQRTEFPDRYKNRLESWCIHNDGFCDNKPHRILFGVETHGNYVPDGYVKMAATRAAKLVLEKYNAQKNVDLEIRQRPTFGAVHDVMFVFDQGTNMLRAHNSVKGEMEYYLMNNLLTDSDVRLGVTRLDEIRFSQDGIYRPILEITTPLGDVAQYREGWKFGITSGTSFPDSDKTAPILSAIMFVVDHAQWRPGAEKHIIIIADEPYKTTEFTSGKSTAEVAAYAKEHNVHVSVT